MLLSLSLRCLNINLTFDNCLDTPDIKYLNLNSQSALGSSSTFIDCELKTVLTTINSDCLILDKSIVI